MKQLLMMAAGLSIICLSAHAAERETNSLTPAKIREFIDHVTEKTKPGGRLDDIEVTTYLNTHLANEGNYASSILFQVPGYPDQVRDLTLTKSEFITNVLQGRKAIRDYNSSVKVGNISINKEKTSATITTMTQEKGKMPVEGNTILPFDGESNCTQELDLINNLIVIKSASCQSRVTISER